MLHVTCEKDSMHRTHDINFRECYCNVQKAHFQDKESIGNFMEQKASVICAKVKFLRLELHSIKYMELN